MALNISRNKDYVKRYSDAKAWVIECESDGTLVGNAWEVLPFMSAPKIGAKEDTAELKDGSNATIHKSNTLDGYEFTCDLLQADKATIDLVKNSRGKFYMLLYKVGEVYGAMQYWFLAPGQISSSNGPDYSDFVKIPLTFTTLKNDTQISATVLPAEVTASPSTLSLTDFVIPANAQAELVEEART